MVCSVDSYPQCVMADFWTNARRAARQMQGLDGSNSVGSSQRAAGGSTPGKAANIDRNREAAWLRFQEDYLVASPRYSAAIFRRRHRMSLGLFKRVTLQLSQSFPFFQFKHDCTGLPGFRPEQKVKAALTLLANDVASDFLEESLAMSSTLANQCLIEFCNGLITLYAGRYLRRPSAQEQARLMAQNSVQGFPGMLGSLDCTHIFWKNCPTAHAGQYAGKEGRPSLVLEVVADQEMWIWHAFFGTPGTQNDLTVLRHSTLFDAGRQVDVPFTVMGQLFDRGYYLTDGIYFDWATLIDSIKHPADEPSKLYARMQEAACKDVERAFGRLKIMFKILDNGVRYWTHERIQAVVFGCLILHNMTLEEQRTQHLPELAGELQSEAQQNRSQTPSARSSAATIQQARASSQSPAHAAVTGDDMARHLHSVQDSQTHRRLKAALREHIWTCFRSQ